MVGSVIGPALGLAGSLLGGGSQSGSSMSTAASFPKWLTPMLQDRFSQLIPQITDTASQPYQAYTGQQVAGFTPDQLQAFGLNQGMVGQAQQGLGQANNILSDVTSQGLNGINPQLLQSYMNPYTQNVINANQTQALQGYDLQKQALQGQQGQTGAFGGSRSAIAQQQLSKNFFNGLNAQNAGLYSQGFQQAQNAAQTGLKLSDIGATQLGNNSMLAQQAGMQQAGVLSSQGAMQQGLNQQNLNIPYQNYLAEQEFPYQQQQYELSSLGSIGNLYKGGVSSQTSTGGPGPWGNMLGMLSMQQGMGMNPLGTPQQTINWNDGGTSSFGGSGLLGGLSSMGNSIGSFLGFSEGGQVPFHKSGDGQHEYGSYASGGLVDPYGSGAAHTPNRGVLPAQEHSAGPYDLSGGPYGSNLAKTLRSPRLRMGSIKGKAGYTAPKPPKVPLMPMMGLGKGYAQGGLVDAVDHFHGLMQHYQCGGQIPHGMYADGGQVDGYPGFFSAAEDEISAIPEWLKSQLGMGQQVIPPAPTKGPSITEGTTPDDPYGTLQNLPKGPGFFDKAQTEMGQGLDWFAKNMTPYVQGTPSNKLWNKPGDFIAAHPKLAADALLLAPEIRAGGELAYAGLKAGSAGLKAGAKTLMDVIKAHPEVASKLARYAGLAAINADDVDKGVQNIKSRTPHYDSLHPDDQAQVNSIVNPNDPVAAHDAAMMARTGGQPNTGPMYGAGVDPMAAIPQSLGEPTPADKAKAIALGNGGDNSAGTGPAGDKYFGAPYRTPNEFTERDDIRARDLEMLKNNPQTQTNPDQGKVNLPLVQFGAALLGSKGNFFQSMGAAGQAWAAQKNAEDINAQRNALLEQLQGTRQEKADAYAEQVSKQGLNNPLNQAYKLAQIQHLQAQGNNPYAQTYTKVYNTLMQNTPGAGMDPAIQAQVQQEAAKIAMQAVSGGLATQQENPMQQQMSWDMLPP